MLRALLFVLLCVVAYLALIYWGQRSVLYPGRFRTPPQGVAARTPDLEVARLPTATGDVEAWYLAVDAARHPVPSPAVVFHHGNGELIDDWTGPFHELRQRGVAALLVEYPGYGRSPGEPSQESIRETALAAFDWLAARTDVDPERIVAYGRSLGGGAACLLARERPVAALLLQSTFTSVSDMAKRMLAPRFAIRDPFDNLSAVRAYTGPVLVIHGRSDDLIPYEHGVALAEAADRGRLVSYRCAHNDCPPDWDLFWTDLTEFLRANGLAP